MMLPFFHFFFATHIHCIIIIIIINIFNVA